VIPIPLTRRLLAEFVGSALSVTVIVGSGIAAAALSPHGGYNPAVTIARVFSDTLAGIAPTSTPAFVSVQMVGILIGFALTALLYTDAARTADDIVIPHHRDHQQRS
jgi:glycerol uptake facilitator-like aquaporin